MKFYTDIVKQSWLITWRHKALWVFGIFIVLWGGKGIESELNSARKLNTDTSPLNPDFWSADHWTALADQAATNGTPLTTLTIVMAVLAVVVIAMIMLSQTGIIDAFNQFADKKTTSDRYALHHAWAAGKKHFWVVLSLNLLHKGVNYLLLGVALAPLFLGETLTNAGVWWVLLGMILYIPVSVVVSIVTRFALNHAVLNHEHLLPSVRDGWKMFRNNVGVALELAIAMMLVFMALIVLVVPVLAAVVTLPSLVVLLANAPDTFGLPWTYIHDRLYLVAFLAIITATSILYSIWHMGSWTMLYKELARGNRASKTRRWITGE